MKHQIFSKIVGSSFCDGQKLITLLKKGDHLLWTREKENKYDSNAILLMNSSKQKLGYIPATTAKDLASNIDNGTTKTMEVVVSEITGGGNVKSVGCNICIITTDEVESF